MDLKSLEQQDTTEYTLLMPSGDKTDIVFTLAGQTHPIRAALEKKLTQRSLRDFNKKGRAVLPEDMEEMRELQVERLTTFTLGWTNMEMNGAPYEFSTTNARLLYANPQFGWLRDQIDEAVRTVENFIKPRLLN